jgi:surface antigen
MTKSSMLFGLVLLAVPLASCATDSAAVAPVTPAAPLASNSPILSGLEPADRSRAEQARATALDGKAGQNVTWTSDANPQTHGTVVAGPLSSQNGTQCRPYTQTVYVNSVPSTARETACHQPNGSWSNAASS